MNSWEVIITSEAAKDIRDIHDYISGTLQIPSTAKASSKGYSKSSTPWITCQCDILYEKEPWRSRGLRKVGVGNFLIFYLPNEATYEVAIFHIFYGGRNIEKMLQDNE